MARGLISLHYGIPLNEVEQMEITDYRLSLFTIFNNAALFSMDPKAFQYNTPEEQADEIINLADLARKRGLSL